MLPYICRARYNNQKYEIRLRGEKTHRGDKRIYKGLEWEKATELLRELIGEMIYEAR